MQSLSNDAIERLKMMDTFIDDEKIKNEIAKALHVRYEVMEEEILVSASSSVWCVRRSKRDGEVYCTCPAYRFRKKSGIEKCKHMLAIDAEGIEVPTYNGKSQRVA